MRIWENEFERPRFDTKSEYGIVRSGSDKLVEFSDEDQFEKYRTENIDSIQWIKRKEDDDFRLFGENIKDIEGFNKKKKEHIDVSFIARSAVFGFFLLCEGVQYLTDHKFSFKIDLFIAGTIFFIVIPFIRNAIGYSKIRNFNSQNLKYEIEQRRFNYWFSNVNKKEPTKLTKVLFSLFFIGLLSYSSGFLDAPLSFSHHFIIDENESLLKFPFAFVIGGFGFYFFVNFIAFFYLVTIFNKFRFTKIFLSVFFISAITVNVISYFTLPSFLMSFSYPLLSGFVFIIFLEYKIKNILPTSFWEDSLLFVSYVFEIVVLNFNFINLNSLLIALTLGYIASLFFSRNYLINAVTLPDK